MTLAFDFSDASLDEAIAHLGAMPLPPYIASRRPPDDEDRIDYQTIFAREEGAVAAPTAGLHFTERLMEALRSARRLAAFRDAACRPRHLSCRCAAPTPAATSCMRRRGIVVRGGRRSAERGEGEGREDRRRRHHLAPAAGKRHRRATASLQPFFGATNLFITPGYRFRFVDRLVTNFHLPRSTLFMLVAAFSGLDLMKRAYAHAIAERYRFYSYGDACLLSPDAA